MMLQRLPKAAGTAPLLPTRSKPVLCRTTPRRQVTVAVQANLHVSSSSSSFSADGSSLGGLSEQPLMASAPHLSRQPQQQQQQQQQQQWRLEAAAGGGDHGSSGGGSGGGGGGGDNSGDDDDEILDLKQAEAAAAAAKVQLPADMIETAKVVGLRSTALSKYLRLQALSFSGSLVRQFPAIRDRMIADDKFLFKVGAEIIIDSVCATVAEVRKRGEDFWAEFEFYLSDLIVGVVLDVALVSLIAPRAVIGSRPMVPANQSGFQKWLGTIPSAALEASQKGVREYSVGSRFACVGVKFLEYSLAGTACGFVGQGVANSLMLLKRQIHGESEHDVAVPPLMKTSLVWGLFMGVSSNLRYQVVFGLERLVDMTIAKQVPAIAYGTTVGIRFVNNVIGGENFIDLARWAGVQ